MKTIVFYYSRKGSNHYLAKKIANSLSSDIERIRPRVNAFMLYLMKIDFGNWKIKNKLSEYDRVILVGPIWMGRFIPPLKGFLKRYKDQIKELVFVTCCGSSYEQKDDKFGHGHVFREVEAMVNGKCMQCQAFPIRLVLPDELKEDSEAFMKTHLNDSNFKGEIVEIYDEFIEKLN